MTGRPVGAILIADDHPLFRQALALAAAAVAPDAELIEAGTIDAALAALQGRGDIALACLDLRMPGADGYSGVALIHAECPDVPILVVSSADPARAAADSVRYGAVGFVGKDADLGTIEAAMRDALAGKRIAPPPRDAEVDAMAAKVASLTPMQLRVLLMVLSGRLNKQIAWDLKISEATVKAHMTAIFRKMDVQNRTQAALAAKALGLEG